MEIIQPSRRTRTRTIVVGALAATLASTGALAQGTTAPSTGTTATGTPTTAPGAVGTPISPSRPPATAATTTPAAPATTTAGTDHNAAVNIGKKTAVDATRPAKGSSSFTAAQATSRIADHGFRDVGGLSKDHDGVWRGHANKDGQQVSVWLDYRGNVGTN